jgi:Holliday junction resolvase RusA-like endonuclease
MLTPYKRDSRLYEQEFGHLPDDQMGRIKYILGKQFENEKFNKDIEARAKKIKAIKWKKLEIVIWKRVKPSARPRFNKRGRYSRVYVPGARENGEWFSEFAEEYKLPFIETPCILNMRVYEKTPSSFSIRNKVLAELGYLKPWKRTGDFDNFAKGISDMIQWGMLKDDCLVIESTQKLFYSIKPHAVLEIKWMEKFPEY